MWEQKDDMYVLYEQKPNKRNEITKLSSSEWESKLRMNLKMGGCSEVEECGDDDGVAETSPSLDSLFVGDSL